MSEKVLIPCPWCHEALEPGSQHPCAVRKETLSTPTLEEWDAFEMLRGAVRVRMTDLGMIPRSPLVSDA